jgi:pimeloyl-ACP methyl ester carboxylesterase
MKTWTLPVNNEDRMGSRVQTVTTADRRTIEVLTAGDPAGYPWLWIPGSPSATADNPWLDELATRLDLRMVTWSRPGYGGSSPRPPTARGPRIVDDIPDIEAILDAFGIEEFIAVGWSGGGPRALAIAAMLPERCRAAATLAGLAPIDARGLDWMAGMAPGNVADFTAALEGPEAYGAFKEMYFLPASAASVDDVTAGLATLLTPSDDILLMRGFAGWLTEMMRRSVVQGVIGVRDDGLALVAPWGFDVESVVVPVAVWAGGRDATVPFAHGKWLAENVPGTVAHLLDEAGHITLVNRLDDVLRELLTLGSNQGTR